MTARYQVRLYEPGGAQSAVFDHWNSLYYFVRLNDTSQHTYSINGLDERRALFTPDTMIEVLRSDPENGVPMHVEYGGFHRTDQDQTTDRGREIFTSYGRSYMDLIHRRDVRYYAGSAGANKSGTADDVIKEYVRENAGPLATVINGRLVDGVTTGLSIDPNASLAPAWSGTAAWRNLMTTISDIAAATGVDFALSRTGPGTFTFSTYYPRLGEDRTLLSNPTRFAPTLGNMSLPFSTFSRVEEANDIIALGQGEGTAREWAQRGDPLAQGAGPWNRIENTIDQRDATSQAELITAADAQLNAKRATRRISFTVRQSPGTIYNRDFGVGDLVVARYRGDVEVKKIVGVEVTIAQGRENIRVHFDDEALVGV